MNTDKSVWVKGRKYCFVGIPADVLRPIPLLLVDIFQDGEFTVGREYVLVDDPDFYEDCSDAGSFSEQEKMYIWDGKFLSDDGNVYDCELCCFEPVEEK